MWPLFVACRGCFFNFFELFSLFSSFELFFQLFQLFLLSRRGPLELGFRFTGSPLSHYSNAVAFRFNNSIRFLIKESLSFLSKQPACDSIHLSHTRLLMITVCIRQLHPTSQRRREACWRRTFAPDLSCATRQRVVQFVGTSLFHDQFFGLIYQAAGFFCRL